jgi:hypothetical protein
MRIRDLNDGFVDSFKKGYAKTAPAEPAPSSAPSADTTQSVFSMLDPRDTKKILATIINGQPLDNRQMSMIKKIYAKL